MDAQTTAAIETIDDSTGIDASDDLHAQDRESPDSAPVPTDDQVRALADGLAQQAQQHEGAQDGQRAAEADSDIFSGPYDPAAAVVAARSEYEASKEQTAGFKKTFDEAVKRLIRVCSHFSGLSQRSTADQPFLKVVDPDDETVITLREKLAKELAVHGQLFVDADGLKVCTREELDTLKLWAGHRGPIPPEIVLQRAHIAANTEDGASCLRCGQHLGRQADATDYPSEARVGLDCPGKAPDEAARPTARRGSKRTKRADPEGEAQQQRVEGKKRSTRA